MLPPPFRILIEIRIKIYTISISTKTTINMLNISLSKLMHGIFLITKKLRTKPVLLATQYMHENLGIEMKKSGVNNNKHHTRFV